MERLFDILLIIIPAGLVLWACYYTMNRFMERERELQQSKLNKKTASTTLPLKLKAYERLVLFLERITPHNMIKRVQQPGMTASQLQLALLKTISQEYEHNMTQQLYVSDAVWNNIIMAKESINQLINASASTLDEEALSIDLSQLIIETYTKLDVDPTAAAIQQLKNEVKTFLQA